MRSLWRTYGPTFRSVSFRLIGDPPNGKWQPIRLTQIVGGRWWSLSFTRTGPIQDARPKAARVTTPAERAPLYAAYRAARQEARQAGVAYQDDGIVQAAVKAYETAEMARLRAQIAEAYAFADELDNDGEQPTLLAIRLRDRLNAAGPPPSDEPAPRWRCNRTERCFREDGHDGPHGFAGTASAPNPGDGS